MKCYLAGRYSRRLELLAYAASLEALGHTITSRWLQGTHESAIPDDALHLPEYRPVAGRYGLEDLEDVEACDMLIAFTEPPLPFASRGGRHVEFGMALAWGKRVMVVGPLENVFCCLPEVEHCDDFAACVQALTNAGELDTPPILIATCPCADCATPLLWTRLTDVRTAWAVHQCPPREETPHA